MRLDVDFSLKEASKIVSIMMDVIEKPFDQRADEL